MVNVAEKLAAEIVRVSALRERYIGYSQMAVIGPQGNLKPAIALMTVAIDGAVKAAGMCCALTQMQALADLEGFEE